MIGAAQAYLIAQKKVAKATDEFIRAKYNLDKAIQNCEMVGAELDREHPGMSDLLEHPVSRSNSHSESKRQE